jgi:hypothetical protein
MNLLTVSVEGKPTRYYLYGVQVSREAYNNRIAKARARGRNLNSFHTKTRVLKGGLERVEQRAAI